MEQDKRLDWLHENIKLFDDKIQEYRNEKYKYNEEYIKLLYEDCKKHNGRCFKEELTYVRVTDSFHCVYYMIINPSDIIYELHGNSFNEYQYKVLRFIYPYDNSDVPFEEDTHYFNFTNKNQHNLEEIKKEEFNTNLNEVNIQWINNIK